MVSTCIVMCQFTWKLSMMPWTHLSICQVVPSDSAAPAASLWARGGTGPQMCQVRFLKKNYTKTAEGIETTIVPVARHGQGWDWSFWRVIYTVRLVRCKYHRSTFQNLQQDIHTTNASSMFCIILSYRKYSDFSLPITKFEKSILYKLRVRPLKVRDLCEIGACWCQVCVRSLGLWRWRRWSAWLLPPSWTMLNQGHDFEGYFECTLFAKIVAGRK